LKTTLSPGIVRLIATDGAGPSRDLWLPGPPQMEEEGALGVKRRWME
jgi:hypothetical protein